MKPDREYMAKMPTVSQNRSDNLQRYRQQIIKLFVDDEPFWRPHANLLSYDRRLNLKSWTLDREILSGNSGGQAGIDQIPALVSSLTTRTRHLLLLTLLTRKLPS